MKKTTTAKKLALHTKTIRVLTANESSHVVGGFIMKDTIIVPTGR